MARIRKVMKVRTRESTERRGCNSTAATKRHSTYKGKAEQTAQSANDTEALTNVCFKERLNSYSPSNMMAEKKAQSI